MVYKSFLFYSYSKLNLNIRQPMRTEVTYDFGANAVSRPTPNMSAGKVHICSVGMR